MKPERSFIKSLKSAKHAGDLADRLGEVALDSVLAEGVLKEIPIIGTAISLFKAGNDLSAYFFAKKILCFLKEIERISIEERADFIERHTKDGDLSEIGEVTLMILEKIDHPELASMIGRAFNLFMNNDIDKTSFDIYCHIVKNLDSYLIGQLHSFYGREGAQDIYAAAAIHLANFGLVQIEILPNYSGSTKTMNKSHARTAFGMEFYKRILSPPQP